MESSLQILLGHLYFRSLKLNYLKANAKVEYGVQLTFTSYISISIKFKGKEAQRACKALSLQKLITYNKTIHKS